MVLARKNKNFFEKNKENLVFLLKTYENQNIFGNLSFLFSLFIQNIQKIVYHSKKEPQ